MSRRELEVTAAEMLRLREEPYCLFNAEIAKRLDCSYVTVLNYIGKQRERKNTAVRGQRPKESSSKNVFSVAQSLTRLGTGDRTWLVDTYRQQVELERPFRFLDAAEIHSIINELTYFEQLLERARKEGKTKCL